MSGIHSYSAMGVVDRRAINLPFGQVAIDISCVSEVRPRYL